MRNIKEILELSEIEDFKTTISLSQIIKAKKLIDQPPKTTAHLFEILSAMNLINAGLKEKQFKDKIHYGMLKPKVTKLLRFILEEEQLKFEIKFYINEQEQCAFIEIYGLQFSFHNITIDETLNYFIKSPRNKVRSWKGFRLQKIAGELFDYAILKKLVSTQVDRNK